jgi:hypothetical protein
MSYSELKIRFPDKEVDTYIYYRLGDYLLRAINDELNEVFRIFIIYYFNMNFL